MNSTITGCMQQISDLMKLRDNQRREISHLACQIKDLKRTISKLGTRRETARAYVESLQRAVLKLATVPWAELTAEDKRRVEILINTFGISSAFGFWGDAPKSKPREPRT